VDSQKIKMRLAVCVEKVDVDLAVSTGRIEPAPETASQAPLDGGLLRVNGRNQTENRHVKIGSYHTLEVVPERSLRLTKPDWDALAVQLLRQAAASIGRAEVGALAIDPGTGTACVCLITPNGIKPIERVHVAVPKKRLGPTSQTEKVEQRFMAACLDAAVKGIRFDLLKAVVIGVTTNAQWRDTFCDQLVARLASPHTPDLSKNSKPSDFARKLVRATVTDGTPEALQAVLADTRVASILSDTKTARERKVLDEYHKTSNMDSSRVTFGPSQVHRAATEGAIRHLLLADSCLRSSDVSQRRFYASIVKETDENGGLVTIFGGGTVLAKDLEFLAGIAAILNWPVE